ncbi:MAG TPA: helix-turn-helix domain-containing protein [Caulobacteraceae bacterium]
MARRALKQPVDWRMDVDLDSWLDLYFELTKTYETAAGDLKAWLRVQMRLVASQGEGDADRWEQGRQSAPSARHRSAREDASDRAQGRQRSKAGHVPRVDTESAAQVDWMRTAEVAAYLRRNLKTLTNWRTAGTGPRYVKRGSIILYRRADVDAWLAEGER